MTIIGSVVKRVVKKSLIVTLGCVVMLATSAQASEKVYRLKLAETWGPNFPIFGDATKNMAAMAEKMSNGRFKFPPSTNMQPQ